MLFYIGIMLVAVFMAASSQIILKTAAMYKQKSILKEYFNIRVLGAYILLATSTLLAIYSLQVIPLSMGAVLDSCSYVFVTFLGCYVLKEPLNKRKLLGLLVIIIGIAIFFI